MCGIKINKLEAIKTSVTQRNGTLAATFPPTYFRDTRQPPPEQKSSALQPSFTEHRVRTSEKRTGRQLPAFLLPFLSKPDVIQDARFCARLFFVLFITGLNLARGLILARALKTCFYYFCMRVPTMSGSLYDRAEMASVLACGVFFQCARKLVRRFNLIKVQSGYV